MSEKLPSSEKNNHSLLKFALYSLGGLALLAAAIAFSIALQTPMGAAALSFARWAFSADSNQVMWYITRSAGLTAYLVLWFSVTSGLAVGSKFLDKLLHRAFTFDFHEFLSLLALGFTLLHIGILLVDRYLPYTVAEILVPFLSPYRPVWVGIGVLGFYLSLLVTVTFYLRSRIGMKAFRAIHLLSLVSYFGVAIHGVFAGTDSSLASVQLMYITTFLTTVGLTAYWLDQVRQKKQRTAVVQTSKVASMPQNLYRR
jgi:sulfoxide reductase heme-binding subunit YedZ